MWKNVFMKRHTYPTDLTNKQYQKIAPYLPQAKPCGKTGRPREYSYREILNAIFYQLRSGGAWRLLPHDLPPWDTVYGYFRRWKQNGLWQTLHDALREQVRVQEGREATPSAAIVDSQSVKTTQKGGQRNLKQLSGMTPERRSKDANAISW